MIFVYFYRIIIIYLVYTFRDKIITVKTFLEYNDIEITPRKFKLKVRFPKTIFKT